MRVRCLAGNADEASAVFRPLSASGWTRIPLSVRETVNGFDHYGGIIPAADGPVLYYFELRRGERVYCFGRTGIGEEPENVRPFRIVPGYAVPAWSRGVLFYQIFPDRFRNGDPENDVRDGEYTYLGRPVVHAVDWDGPLEPFDVHRFYGGDLEGIREKLGYLSSLGVEALYLNPVFTSPSNHKYDTADYGTVDPHLGGDGALISLISDAHAAGIRVILDGVFNHCGASHFWFDADGRNAGKGLPAGAYTDAGSPYREYFRFRDENAWPDNPTAEYWWGNRTLPKLAYEDSEKLREEILSIAEKYVRPPYCADGWRLDVAADLGHGPEFNHAFWHDFRERVRAARPDALILAEHYGDPADYLAGGEWDTVMNYDAFMDPVSRFLTGMEKHSDSKDEALTGDAVRFAKEMTERMASFGTASLQAAMNELSNHDHSRFLTRTGGLCGRLREMGPEAAGKGVRREVMCLAVLLQMTWPGAPAVYYGDEAGQVGFTDPDSRRTYPWGREDELLLGVHRALGALRKKDAPVWKTGSFKILLAAGGCIAYARFTGDTQYVVVLNRAEEPCAAAIPVYEAGLPEDRTVTAARVFYTAGAEYDTMETAAECRDGVMKCALPAVGGAVFRMENT